MAQPWDFLLLPAGWAFLLGAPLPAAPLFAAPHLAAPILAAPFPADPFPADPFPAFQFFCTAAIIRALRHSSPATARKEHLSQLLICRCRVTAEFRRVLPNSAAFCRILPRSAAFCRAKSCSCRLIRNPQQCAESGWWAWVARYQCRTSR